MMAAPFDQDHAERPLILPRNAVVFGYHGLRQRYLDRPLGHPPRSCGRNGRRQHRLRNTGRRCTPSSAGARSAQCGHADLMVDQRALLHDGGDRDAAWASRQQLSADTRHRPDARNLGAGPDRDRYSGTRAMGAAFRLRTGAVRHHDRDGFTPRLCKNSKTVSVSPAATLSKVRGSIDYVDPARLSIMGQSGLSSP